MKAGNKASSLSSLAVASVGAATLAVSLWMYHHNSNKNHKSDLASGDSEVDGGDAQKSKKDDMLHREIDIDGSMADGLGRILAKGTITIAYCSTTGTCEGFAKKNYKLVQLIQVSEVDWWDELLNNEGDADDIGGSVLSEISTDWRVAPEPLRSSSPELQLKVGAFGMGHLPMMHIRLESLLRKYSLAWLASWCTTLVSKNVGGKREGKAKSKSLMVGDSEVGDSEVVFEKWMNGIVNSVIPVGQNNVIDGKKKPNGNSKKQQHVEEKKKGEEDCACKSSGDTSKNEAGCCSNQNSEDNNEAGCCSNEKSDENDSMTDSLSEEEDYDDDDDDDSEGDVLDVEDMGNVIKSQSSSKKSREPKEMVTPKQAKALKKEGYRLIGTHSAVKLCRWTKHQLRGRGGCYKHTHYGITSYQCMEATPSLACANKCGMEMETDDPKMIVEEAVNMHVDMIKETRGIPGIQMDRWAEAHKSRWGAYHVPRINELLHELHDRKISTFLVTNGQHPQAINDLVPITQLYVSVDASTPESLEAVDRPLFKDAWDRLKTSLSCLKNKGQRTVKGVTFCGKSDASNLNMSNSPWHHEVLQFTKLLLKELNAIREGGDDLMPEYDLACEHKHSCSVLLARVDQFAVPDENDPTKRKWRTWIDYDKFQELAAKHAADPTFTFGVEDYVADTPSWAVAGADEEGFDPTDNRHRKKKKHPKYTKFDDDGIPTHDTFNEPLEEEEMLKLRNLMIEKKKIVGEATTVTELQGGERVIDDASLMFRGLTVSR
ncbi:S-adenosyl-L-methionine-dependent tRNA 4-demethylwyosine synthase [Skeletonema marinoi]|uniref:S-adenosyl-L-methionine-dependent tRNA 4-demethylwyosine synthase n=1 Tax=Skeletonema marinoi TaxID=267567 RepID=A0AAD9DGK9_9STRA|nr:S-adenosyl-L-methionine-dependent tRNA 4-demethylwyosine synthase [Skeletonema marinoi]